MGSDPMLCSNCGWTGERAALPDDEGDSACPVCDTDIEFVD